MKNTITVQNVVIKHLEDLNIKSKPQSVVRLVNLCGKDLIWKIFQERFFQVAPTVLLCRLEVFTGVVQGKGMGNHKFNLEMVLLGLGDYELELELICNEYLHYLGVQK